MEENKDLTLIDLDSTELENNTKELATSIVKEVDVDKIKDLTKLFNLNQMKKNTLRVLKLNDLYDKVSDQMIERFEERPDEFSNQDLLNYMTTVQGAIEKAQKSIDLVEEVPAVITNQQNNQININMGDNLTRESREKIAEALKSILSKCENMGAEAVYKEESEMDSNTINNEGDN